MMQDEPKIFVTEKTSSNFLWKPFQNVPDSFILITDWEKLGRPACNVVDMFVKTAEFATMDE